MRVYLLPQHHLLRKLIRGYGKVKPPASSYVGRAFPIFLGEYQRAEKWSKLYHQASIVVPQGMYDEVIG